MEVKISISDNGSPSSRIEMPAHASAPAPATPAANAAEVTDAGQAGAGGTSGVGASGDMGAPADLLMRAAEMGAMNAGPAPDLSMFQQGAPPPFITGQMGQMAAASGVAGAVASESAGASPGTAARVVTHTAPEGSGGRS